MGNQKEDRLGRDVVYIYDGMGTKVGQEAIHAWEKRGPYLASDFGLSDERFISNYVATPANGYGGVEKKNAATAGDPDDLFRHRVAANQSKQREDGNLLATMSSSPPTTGDRNKAASRASSSARIAAKHRQGSA